MKPIIKYQGGKTRELPIIKKLAPTEFNRIIEPFAGGAAVSFAYSILCTNVLLPVDGLLGSLNPPP